MCIVQITLKLKFFSKSNISLHSHSLHVCFFNSKKKKAQPTQHARQASLHFSRFGPSSFSGNPGLCGELLNNPCPAASSSPFFDVPAAAASPLAAADSEDTVVLPPNPRAENNNKTGVVVGLVVTVVILAAVALLLSVGVRRRRRATNAKAPKLGSPARSQPEPEPVEETRGRAEKSGDLVFAPGEAELYGLSS